jgi:hypothetical protein
LRGKSADLLDKVKEVTVVVRSISSTALISFCEEVVCVDDELNGELAEAAIEVARDRKSLGRIEVRVGT